MVSSLGQVCGQILSAFYQLERDQWKQSIDDAIPDFFPLNYMQSGLQGIVDWVFNWKIEAAKKRGQEIGDNITNKLNATVSEAKTVLTRSYELSDGLLNTKILSLEDRLRTLEGKNKIGEETSYLHKPLF